MLACGDWWSLNGYGLLDVFSNVTTFSSTMYICFRSVIGFLFPSHLYCNSSNVFGGVVASKTTWIFMKTRRLCVRVVFVFWSVLFVLCLCLLCGMCYGIVSYSFLRHFVCFIWFHTVQKHKKIYIVLYLTCPSITTYRFECSKMYVLFWLVKFINCCMFFCNVLMKTDFGCRFNLTKHSSA